MAPTPLTPDEAARFRGNMSEWLAKELVEKGSLRLSAVDDPELQRHFQEAVHRASELLGRPVISMAGPRGMTFELGDQPLTDRQHPPLTP
ncbi:hypothetical protein GCM10009733_001380 [Nonomuraea maheshkhaliensis]|uniref:Uncharacterized protein n=1 Tax=Nonomuraea maheshkhaliensis TaxID=419590 RepID=A0ABP4QFE8_9ACTN